MQSKVFVVADEATNTVINISKNNPEYGYVRLQQVRILIDDNGFLKRNILSALIQAPIILLKKMEYYGGQMLEGTIVIKESLTPFSKKDATRDLKIAGTSGILCKVGNEPIYRKTVYSSSANATDIRIQHDNIEELREAYNNNKLLNENLESIEKEFEI
jgi:hypothetical protein